MLDQRIDEVRGCIATDFSFAQLVPIGGISLKRYLDNGDLIATRVLRRFYAMNEVEWHAQYGGMDEQAPIFDLACDRSGRIIGAQGISPPSFA